jgi:DNA-binding MarR family transcriptional regulator
MNGENLSGGVDDPDSWIVPELLIRFIRATYELNRCEPKHGGGLSAQQIRALLYLVHHGGTTIKELAQALCLSEARASRLADELVDAGHILHQRDVNDRRQVHLHVAPAASEKAQQIYRERSGALKAALSDASEQELGIFTRLLGCVVDEFEALARRTATPHVVTPEVHAGMAGLTQEPPPPMVADPLAHPVSGLGTQQVRSAIMTDQAL